jgi:hypothetical protein
MLFSVAKAEPTLREPKDFYFWGARIDTGLGRRGSGGGK